MSHTRHKRIVSTSHPSKPKHEPYHSSLPLPYHRGTSAIEQLGTQAMGHYRKGTRENWEWYGSEVTIQSVHSHNETVRSNSNWAWVERLLVRLMSGSSVRNITPLLVGNSHVSDSFDNEGGLGHQFSCGCKGVVVVTVNSPR